MTRSSARKWRSLNNNALTVTVGDHTVWSSELAPTLIFGGVPVSFAKLFNALRVNELGAFVPVQSGHLSCSMENERSVDTSGLEDPGGDVGTETLKA